MRASWVILTAGLALMPAPALLASGLAVADSPRPAGRPDGQANTVNSGAPAALRPRLRPASGAVVRLAGIVSPAALPAAAPAAGLSAMAPVDGLRPAPRPGTIGAVRGSQTGGNMSLPGSRDPGFERWIAAFHPIARRAGITDRTFERAFAGVRLDPEVVRRDSNQAEFVKPIWDYLDSAVSERRVRDGRAELRSNRVLLDQIAARYGVPPSVVVAIWGMESAYGKHRGRMPVIQSLATLAYEGRRAQFFQTQLVDALKIIQNGDVTPARMTGSWAGAMGHTQFIPSSYLQYAVDFRGDGKRDIWSDDPTDALASTAAYLARNGWQTGAPWGVEVRLPPGFDYALGGRHVRLPVSRWAALGVSAARGGGLPDAGPAQLLLPAGARGAAFLVFRNFDVIARYNAADAYVLAVGLLSDRIAGAPPFNLPWPRNDRVLSRGEKRELQILLTRAGYNTHGADGMIGPNTVKALRNYQRAAGLLPDGYASPEVLRHLR